jgi:ribosomal protein S18 acetylase RimI-like enzyme
MPMEIQLKRVTLDDVSKLQKIGIQTFTETFGGLNSVADMESYIHSAFDSAKLLAELGDAHTEMYFALHNKQTIGYLKLNRGPAQTELKEQGGLEIERIYVLQAYFGQQVGQLLFDKALQIAQACAVEYIWLGVWEQNARAIRFYEKNGFQQFGSHVFKLGEDEQNDILMKYTL